MGGFITQELYTSELALIAKRFRDDLSRNGFGWKEAEELTLAFITGYSRNVKIMNHTA